MIPFYLPKKKSLAVLTLYREPENWKSVKEKDILPNYILRGLCSTITCSLVAYPQFAGKYLEPHSRVLNKISLHF